jgi:DNA-binding transcriptional regulator YdaS (Cro superfamily)
LPYKNTIRIIVGMNLETYLSSSGETQAEFAEKAGLTQGAISHLIKKARNASSETCRLIGIATSWQVSPHDLRPDMYPNPWDGLPVELAMQMVSGNQNPYKTSGNPQ